MTQRLWLLALMIAMAAPGAALAQNPSAQNPPAQSPSAQSARSPIQGMLQDQQNQDLPVQIDAASLEVQDKNKMATFSGDVHVTQGDMTMKCQSLVVFYGPERGPGAGQTVASAAPLPSAPAANAPPGARPQPGAMPQGAQDIRRIEARGGVTVTSKDQNASGDLGVYDLKKKTITLTGNVVVSQGKNVLHGERVVVDTVTGNAHFESGSATQNRVRALILPSKGANGGGSPNAMSIGPPRPN
jgi:lipopolysaccharide export system protein LptA